MQHLQLHNFSRNCNRFNFRMANFQTFARSMLSRSPMCVSHTMQARPTLSMSPALNSSSVYGNVYIWKTQIEIYPLHLFLDQCLICYYRLLHGAYSQSPYSQLHYKVLLHAWQISKPGPLNISSSQVTFWTIFMCMQSV